MTIRVRHLAAFFAAAALVASLPAIAHAKTAPVNLGACASYGVFSEHVISNTATSTVIGDLGLAPGGHPLPTGLIVSGKTTTDDGAPLAALRAAYADAMSRPFDATITGDLGGVTLPPGVYRGQAGSSEEDSTVGPNSFQVNGTLTLDAKGDPDATWIFQADDDLWFGRGARIDLINGARFCRVFFAVDDANLTQGSYFQGHILAAGVIRAGGADVRGQLLSSGDQAVAGDGEIYLGGTDIDNSAYTCPDTPSLPKTGYAPRETDTPWLPIAGAMATLVAASCAVRAVRRRARAAR